MVAANPNHRMQSTGRNPAQPINGRAERARYYFEQQVRISSEAFFLESIGGEIAFSEPEETGSATRLPITAEDIRIHAWLNERLAIIHDERRRLWPKLRRLLFGDKQ